MEHRQIAPTAAAAPDIFAPSHNLLHANEPDPQARFFIPADSEVAGYLLNEDLHQNRGDYINSLCNLQEHMWALLQNSGDWDTRRKLAIGYADSFYDELGIDKCNLTYDQRSVCALMRVHLSAVSSLGHLSELM
jgi:hypothetical protein